MAKTKNSKRADSRAADGVYLLKLVLYLIIGSLWVKTSHGESIEVGLPVGFAIGLIFTLHEHFRIDRKIEYAVLLVAMLVGYFAPYGLYINL